MKTNNIYEQLGVTPVINAAGTFTDLGGSLMQPEVTTAWQEAAQHFVDLGELQERVGSRIANLLQVEAALVTGGAASGIVLGTAAAITQRDDAFPTRNVVSDNGQPYEVMRPTSHRDLYDRQLETCGVTIVDVDTAEDVDRLISPRTVLMMSYNVYEPASPFDHPTWLQLAAKHGIPTLLDAAADVPPVENFWRYCHLGYDMVTFSGGKAIRGPQSSGLLLGRKQLIESAKLNAQPNEGTIGRVAKVSKEDIVALWKALELFLGDGEHSGHHIHHRCQQQLETVEKILQDVDDIALRYITPQVANHFPHLLVDWDVSALGITPEEMAIKLRESSPPIATGRVYGTGTNGLLISAINLQSGEERIVGERILEVFQERTA